MYQLTKLKRFTSYRKIADEISLEDEQNPQNNNKLSPKTVQRWFNFLKQKYCHPKSKTHDKFDYFPTFFYEKLGLCPLYVISEKPNTKLLKLSSLQRYQDYAAWLYDINLRSRVLLNGYLVPIQYFKKFEQEWVKIKKHGIVKNYKFYITNKGFNIYSPWHKVIDKNGIFHPEKNDEEEINQQVSLFQEYINNLPEVRMIPQIKENPLIIPTLFEHYHEYLSSSQVWQALKTKLGEEVWCYIRKKKKQSDGVGIKKVQQTIKDVYNFNLLHQMRVVYMPLELEHNFFIYLILKFKNKKDIIKNIKEFAMNSIYISVYPKQNNKVFLIALINNKSLGRVFSLLENIEVIRMLYLEHEKSLPLLTEKKYKKFNYAKLFDVKSLKWIY